MSSSTLATNTQLVLLQFIDQSTKGNFPAKIECWIQLIAVRNELGYTIGRPCWIRCLIITRDYKYIDHKGRHLSHLPEITDGVVLYEFYTLCTVLPSYESAKMTNLTAISRMCMSHRFSSLPLHDDRRIRGEQECVWTSTKVLMKTNVLDKILEMAVKFVFLADSELGNTVLLYCTVSL